MIHSDSFSADWLTQLRTRYSRIDPGIAEKMIFALVLVERLTQHLAVPFVFKGGTSLVLLLGKARRFSVDVDIVTEASLAELRVALEAVCVAGPFTRFEYDERRSTKDGVPRAHFYLFYASVMPHQSERYIALDVLFEPLAGMATVELPVSSAFVREDGPPVAVSTPTLAAITGDKLTAFAPNTTGIRYGQSKEQEIIKQLFDLGHLFDAITDVAGVASGFANIVGKELVYRDLLLSTTAADVLLDAVRTAQLMAMVKLNRVPPAQAAASDELRQGLLAFRGFVIGEPYREDDAVLSAAKVAYLAARLLVGDYAPLPRFEAVSGATLPELPTALNFLNRLRAVARGEALWWWRATGEVLAGWSAKWAERLSK